MYAHLFVQTPAFGSPPTSLVVEPRGVSRGAGALGSQTVQVRRLQQSQSGRATPCRLTGILLKSPSRRSSPEMAAASLVPQELHCKAVLLVAIDTAQEHAKVCSAMS